MKSKKQYLHYTLFPAAIGLLIFYGTCLMDVDNIPKIESRLPLDKVVHFGMFFVLAVVNGYCYYEIHKGYPKTMRWFFWGLILPIIYGGAIEVLQEQYFSRNAEWGDFIADVLGVLCGMLLVIYCLKRKKTHKKKYLCSEIKVKLNRRGCR